MNLDSLLVVNRSDCVDRVGSCRYCYLIREYPRLKNATKMTKSAKEKITVKTRSVNSDHIDTTAHYCVLQASQIMAADGTPLQTSFCFSYMRRGGKGAAGKTAAAPDAGGEEAKQQQEQGVVHPYENSIKTIATVSTVEGFWATYDFLKRPNDLPTTTDYHFFRGGIKPTWEDAGNAKGGKWIVRLPKGLSSRYWEEIILALIGGQFSGVPDGEICGAVLSVRYSEDILGVWNRTAGDRDLVLCIRDAIKKVLLMLPAHANMEYKPHQTSMQDRSSFRNTQVWKSKSLVGLEGRSDSRGKTARSGSWSEREERKSKRDSGRSWR